MYNYRTTYRAAMRGDGQLGQFALAPHWPPDPTQFIVGGQVFLLCCPGPTKTSWRPCIYNINILVK